MRQEISKEVAVSMLAQGEDIGCYRFQSGSFTFSKWRRQAVVEVIKLHGAKRAIDPRVPEDYTLRVDGDVTVMFFKTREGV